ncbi:MAG TPA: four helix bundle protein [Planctomycetota bacterium]|nr:four helix bundle protein [Planctomycetota bacterium]
MKIARFEDMESWKAARRLRQAVAQVTCIRHRIPDRELVGQIRQCTRSIMANIAEGFDAGTRPEFARFLRIALRSGSELQSHLYAALDDQVFDSKTFDALYEQARVVKALIGGFIRYLRKREEAPRP